MPLPGTYVYDPSGRYYTQQEIENRKKADEDLAKASWQASASASIDEIKKKPQQDYTTKIVAPQKKTTSTFKEAEAGGSIGGKVTQKPKAADYPRYKPEAATSTTTEAAKESPKSTEAKEDKRTREQKLAAIVAVAEKAAALKKTNPYIANALEQMAEQDMRNFQHEDLVTRYGAAGAMQIEQAKQYGVGWTGNAAPGAAANYMQNMMMQKMQQDQTAVAQKMALYGRGKDAPEFLRPGTEANKAFMSLAPAQQLAAINAANTYRGPAYTPGSFDAAYKAAGMTPPPFPGSMPNQATMPATYRNVMAAPPMAPPPPPMFPMMPQMTPNAVYATPPPQPPM